MLLYEDRFQLLTPDLQKQVINYIDFLLKHSTKSNKKLNSCELVGGSLQVYSDPMMRNKEKQAWSEAAKEKYESHRR